MLAQYESQTRQIDRTCLVHRLRRLGEVGRFGNRGLASHGREVTLHACTVPLRNQRDAGLAIDTP